MVGMLKRVNRRMESLRRGRPGKVVWKRLAGIETASC